MKEISYRLNYDLIGQCQVQTKNNAKHIMLQNKSPHEADVCRSASTELLATEAGRQSIF